MSADFAPFEAKMRAAELPAAAIRAFRHAFDAWASGGAATLSRREIEPLPDDELAEASTLGPAEAARGRAALARTVVIKLNGGLGTSMGMTRAKSLLPIKNDLCFLDVIARQLLRLRETHGEPVPLLLMNSFRTRADSLAVLARHPGLASGLPPDFLQHKVPRIRADEGTPVRWPEQPEHEWCPPGHGDLYTALGTSGLLHALRARGFRHAFVSNADNLGADLDLGILGWFAASRAPFAMEVCDRSEADRKGGHLARRRDGRLVLRESAQCPDDEQEDFQDVAVHRFFNTNNLWLDLPALARQLEERGGFLPLPLIRNEKPVDPLDPASPRVIQLETAMGAAISIFEGARALRVARTRFAPVKTSSDLLAVRSDAYVLDAEFRVRAAPERAGAPLWVDLDPRFYRSVEQLDARFPAGPPSLVRCRRFAVRGDVYFGGGVQVVGEVELAPASPGPHRVPQGARLE